ncbi:hypothetical protein FHR33_008164 [Nonomuraea dietziae]|uniref:Uncharacterized protein n=1 Tax=Nonomuraea dietziae TaxID=65515 RepID=A0A7W5VIN9_9ACTN|nr:hypothetical protein [Nonomuraea dietziae]
MARTPTNGPPSRAPRHLGTRHLGRECDGGARCVRGSRLGGCGEWRDTHHRALSAGISKDGPPSMASAPRQARQLGTSAGSEAPWECDGGVRCERVSRLGGCGEFRDTHHRALSAGISKDGPPSMASAPRQARHLGTSAGSEAPWECDGGARCVRGSRLGGCGEWRDTHHRTLSAGISTDGPLGTSAGLATRHLGSLAGSAPRSRVWRRREVWAGQSARWVRECQGSVVCGGVGGRLVGHGGEGGGSARCGAGQVRRVARWRPRRCMGISTKR